MFFISLGGGGFPLVSPGVPWCPRCPLAKLLKTKKRVILSNLVNLLRLREKQATPGKRIHSECFAFLVPAAIAGTY